MSADRIKDFSDIVTQPFRQFKQLFKHPYSCYMLAAIQYNNAMFHIFSGPLFANVEGYVYLDLIIWGISPLIYLLFRPSLSKMLQPDINTSNLAQISQTNKLIKQIQKHKKHLNFVHKRRLCSLIVFSVAIFVSFLFMNYSQTFNWNYFTRIINMDIGYLIFDFACRSMQLIVQIQEDEQIQEKYNNCQTQFQLQQMKQTALKVEKCKIYCKFKNFSMFLSYGVVFLLFTNGFDVNLRYSGQEVLAFTSFISCIITFFIPLLYFFHFKAKYFQKWDFFNIQQNPTYKPLNDEQQKSQTNEKHQQSFEVNECINDTKNIKSQQQIQRQLKKIKRIICKANKPCSPPTHGQYFQDSPKSFLDRAKFVINSKQLRGPLSIFILIFFAFIINVSYLALWIMETLKHEQNYIQYNETLLISAAFLMVGSGLFWLSSRINLSYPFEIDRKEGNRNNQIRLIQPIEWGYYINKIFLLILGVILLVSFSLIPNNIYMFILSTIGLGFHLALFNYVYFKVQKIIQQLQIEIDLQILSLQIQTIAYLVVPVIITITQTTNFTYSIYGFISSLSMILAAILL